MEAASKAVKDIFKALVEVNNPEKALLLFSRQLQDDHFEDEDINVYIFGIRLFFCQANTAPLRKDTEAIARIRAEWIRQNDELYEKWLASTDDTYYSLKWEKWTFQAKNMVLDEFIERGVFDMWITGTLLKLMYASYSTHVTMSLTPFSREKMRAFKAQKDAEGHALKLETIIKDVYLKTVQYAERNSDTFYALKVGSICCQNAMLCRDVYVPSNTLQNIPTLGDKIRFDITPEYIVENIEEILARLRTLFPGCTVEYKKVTVAIGRDGKEYDISTIDTSLYQLVDLRHSKTEEHIVIDWS